MRCQQVFNSAVVAAKMAKMERLGALQVKIVEGGVDFFVGTKLPGLDSREREFLEMAYSLGPANLCELQLGLKVFSQGIKCFAPSAQNLEALENIDIRFGLADYSQPFETMIIEFPGDYSQKRMVSDVQMINGSLGVTKPTFGVIWHDSAIPLIIIGIWQSTQQVATACLYNDGEDNTIEELLSKYENSPGNKNMTSQEIINTKNQIRACLNSASLLMEVGTAQPVRSNPDHYTRCVRRGNLIEAELVPLVLEFSQKVRLYEMEEVGHRAEPTGESGIGRRITKVFWRRGFRRRQHYGQGNALTKIVTIKPVLVNKDRYAGDNFGATVEYT